MKERFSHKASFMIAFFVVGVLVAGVVFSQGSGNSFAGTAQNPGHDASQITCNNCVKTQFIEDETILDQDISFSAAINPQKVKGINGYYSQITNTLSTSPHDLPLSETWGISSWAGRRVETVCDTGIATDIVIMDGMIGFTGAGQYYNKVFNHYAIIVPQVGSGINLGGSLGNGWTRVYQAETFAISYGLNPDAIQGSRNLYMRVNTVDSSKLQVGQVVTGNGYGPIASWRCFVKFVS